MNHSTTSLIPERALETLDALNRLTIGIATKPDLAVLAEAARAGRLVVNEPDETAEDRSARLEQRNALIRRARDKVTAFLPITLAAEKLADELGQVAEIYPWKRTGKNAAILRKIIELNEGRTLSKKQIYNIFNGL